MPPSTAPPPSRCASAGFTLIELMVAAALAMLLLAGAFEMHTAFNRQTIRQQEIADMQQSLRVAMQVIGRSVRNAGTGLAGGTMQLYNTGVVGPVPCPTPTGTPPNPQSINSQSMCLWPVQFSNGSTYAHPKTTFDTVIGDNDGDSDWLRVIAFDGATATAVNRGLGGDDPAHNVLGISDVRNMAVGNFILFANGYPVLSDGSQQPTLGWRSGCVRQITAVQPNLPMPAAPLPAPGTVTYAVGVSNPVPTDPCMLSALTTVRIPGQTRVTYVYPIDRSVVFRVAPPTGPGVPPRLQAWYSAPGAPSFMPNVGAGQIPWQTLAENIENMQIAVIMSDGTVCGNAANSVDSPALCNPQRMRAVRVTLVARSSSAYGSTQSGLFSGWLSQGTGAAWEDYNQPASPDGYLRRSLTTEFQIRNVPSAIQ